jgi:predicted RNA-binding protein (virulence factor B family)
MEKILLGDYNHLEVVRFVDFGAYLAGGEEGDVLLPARYVPKDTKVGDWLDVFVYLDQEERLVATTERPLAKVGEFACLKVAWVNKYGAFLDWGLMKDLFCPFAEQKKKMAVGEHHVVHIHIDEESYRIVASAKVERYIDHDAANYYHNDSVDLLVWQRTELGWKVIVDNKYAGMVYDNQIYRSIHMGDRLKGYIDQVRDDGKIDVMLQPSGRQQTKDFADALTDWLIAHGGVCEYGDKTDAETIKAVFGVSKKTFKRAVGDLYKHRVIVITEEGLRLTTDGK